MGRWATFAGAKFRITWINFFVSQFKHQKYSGLSLKNTGLFQSFKYF